MWWCCLLFFFFFFNAVLYGYYLLFVDFLKDKLMKYLFFLCSFRVYVIQCLGGEIIDNMLALIYELYFERC